MVAANDKLTKVLLLFLSIAFSAWSVAVWRAVSEIGAVAQEIRIIAQRLEHTDEAVKKHVAKDWHEGAGEAIIRLQEQQMRSGE